VPAERAVEPAAVEPAAVEPAAVEPLETRALEPLETRALEALETRAFEALETRALERPFAWAFCLRLVDRPRFDLSGSAAMNPLSQREVGEGDFPAPPA
jgi:hypothetical protein